MPTFQELDQLSTDELRDRAFHLARRRLDVRFFWNLLESAPAAEAAVGHEEHAEVDVLSFSERVKDALGSDEREVEEALRPIYIDYVLEHERGTGPG